MRELKLEDMFEVTDEALSPQALIDKVAHETLGAIVVFLGVARRFSRGKVIKHLEYEVFREMAAKKIAEIGREIREKWQLDRVAIAHRVGHLEIGEASIVIAVGAPHRRQAFEACEYAINRVKQTVPIWKKEVTEDGEFWIEGEFSA